MTRFIKAQIGLILASITLALIGQNISYLSPFQKAQVAEVSLPPISDNNNELNFSPSYLNINDTQTQYTVDLILKQSNPAITTAGFTIGLNYDTSLIEITSIEPYGDYTQQLGGIDYQNSPIMFTFVRPLTQDTVQSNLTMTPLPPESTPPEGCYYQEVRCIREPCNPILVCADSTSPTASMTPLPVSQETTVTRLVKITFKAKSLPIESFETQFSFYEASVVAVEQDGNIVTLSNPMIMRIGQTPPPTSDPTSSITCRPIVYKVKDPSIPVGGSDVVATDSSIINAQVGDNYGYGVQVTNVSNKKVTTTGVPLTFTAQGDPMDFQKIYSNLNICNMSSSNNISCTVDHLSLDAGSTISIPSGTSLVFPLFTSYVHPPASGQLSSTYNFTFGRGQSCGTITVVPEQAKEGDLNRDGSVNIFDYQYLIINFGNPFNIFDYQKIISNYGL